MELEGLGKLAELQHDFSHMLLRLVLGVGLVGFSKGEAMRV